ncbi:MAG: hypothetical protein AAAFM81_08725, partial [Pseudomonadota bacterium]
MRMLCKAILLMVLPVSWVLANDDATPDASQWYIHMDFQAMRDSGAGKPVYEWMREEIFEELKDDTGFDADKELTSITAYSASEDDATMIVRGKLRSDSQDKLLAALAVNGDTEIGQSGKMNYFRIQDIDVENEELQIDTDVIFLTFDRKNTWILSTSLESLESAFASNARALGSAADSLLVLSAKNPIVQGGVNAEKMSDQWNSGMLRNTRQIAFRLADNRGKADMLMRITAKDETTSNALASIVRGLIGLQAISSDTNETLSKLLSSLNVESDQQGLTIGLTVDPDELLV